MTEHLLRYDRMVEEALRQVVKDALDHVVKKGLPGQHHFYITFKTRFPSAQVPAPLLAKYPDEMTIVLQHQFWDLDVGEDHFAVTLAFSGVNQRLRVPYAAISSFADPSAKFGLQFHVEMGPEPMQVPVPPPASVAGLVKAEVQERKAAEGADAEPAAKTGTVVALDAFRKK